MSLTLHEEPSWGTVSEDREPRLSVFRELPFSPTQFKALFVRLFQWHFSSPDQFYNTQLYPLVWTSDPLTTKILISDVLIEDDRMTSKRPAIGIRIGEISVGSSYINPSTLQVSIGGDPVEYPVYHNLIVGSFQAVCESTSAPESERLAEELFRLLLSFSPSIQADANLKGFSVGKMEGASRREKGVERHVSSVLMNWTASAFSRVPQETAW